MKKTSASDVMSPNVKSVGADWSIDRLVTFLTDNAITGAPVVADGGEPIGVVSLTDVARSGTTAEHAREQPHAFYRQGEALFDRTDMKGMHLETESSVTVRDIMTPMVFAVEEATPVQEIAEMMVTGRIHRVFVKRGARMVGIITSMDLLPLVRDM